MTSDVGHRLRIIRTRHGLSQRELARRSGITNATISLIESGSLNPSVGSLKRILDGIPLDLGEFFSMDTSQSESVFFPAEQLVEISAGPISYRQVGRDMHDRAMQVLHERYQPGADTGKVRISHEGEEAGVIIRGRLEVRVGDQRRILGPGDAYYFDSRIPHRFRNVGDEVCELVSACAPPGV